MYKVWKNGGRYVLSLDNHVEITEAVRAFVKEYGIKSGEISGLGAVSEATFRFLNPATKSYVDKRYEQQMEITSLVGNISEKDGEPYLHIHLTCSDSGYHCVGGHLLSAVINGACELFVHDYGIPVGRAFDPETGLNLYD